MRRETGLLILLSGQAKIDVESLMISSFIIQSLLCVGPPRVLTDLRKLYPAGLCCTSALVLGCA